MFTNASQMSFHIKTFKTPPSRLYMILSCKDLQLHYLSSFDSSNTVTLMSFTTFLLSCLQIFVLYCSYGLDWLIAFPLAPSGSSFSSFRSRLRYFLFREIFSDPKWSLITLCHPGVSFTVVLHISILFNSFTCLLSPSPELQESRGLLPGLTTKLPVITTSPGTL